jgi:hypothetical protein
MLKTLAGSLVLAALPIAALAGGSHSDHAIHQKGAVLSPENAK